MAPSGAGQLNTFQVSLRYLPGTSTPLIAYRNSNTCNMRFGALSGGAFSIRDVENIGAGCGGAGGIHGEIQLLFVGAAQKPALAYHTHNPGTGARYAVCTANCSSAVTAPTWVFQFADSNGNAGHYLTAFVDPISFLPRLGYQVEVSNTGPELLRYATCADGVAPNTCDNAKGTWTTVDLENTAGSAYWNSMAIAPVGAPNAGKPAIAYEDASTNAVRLAVCTANCGDAASSAWSFQTVISPSAGNYFTTLQYDSAGLAHITFIDPTPQTLRYAIQRAPGTATSWQFFDIDTGVDDGHSSFILTALGSTHVSYSLTTGLKYYPFGD